MQCNGIDEWHSLLHWNTHTKKTIYSSLFTSFGNLASCVAQSEICEICTACVLYKAIVSSKTNQHWSNYYWLDSWIWLCPLWQLFNTALSLSLSLSILHHRVLPSTLLPAKYQQTNKQQQHITSIAARCTSAIGNFYWNNSSDYKYKLAMIISSWITKYMLAFLLSHW